MLLTVREKKLEQPSCNLTSDCAGCANSCFVTVSLPWSFIRPVRVEFICKYLRGTVKPFVKSEQFERCSRPHLHALEAHYDGDGLAHHVQAGAAMHRVGGPYSVILPDLSLGLAISICRYHHWDLPIPLWKDFSEACFCYMNTGSRD